MSLENMDTRLYNIGLSYKRADMKTRGVFSISKQNQILLLKEAKEKDIDGIFVISTCNRTEIIGFSKDPFELISLLCKYSKGSVEDFVKFSSIYKNKQAIQHLFHIATGLDSQILGDYEIVGQLKEAFQLAKTQNTLNAYLERLVNLTLQASKEVKTTTKLSSGITSVSYAVIQYIMDKVENYNCKNILIYGFGDIGKNTCKNLVKYTKNKNITLVNRTLDKAQEFVKKHPSIRLSHIENLILEIEKADILIVSTGSEEPTITLENLKNNKKLLIIDLSIPENVATTVRELENVSLINIDELSKITDKTISEREKEITKVKKIIKKYLSEFMEWQEQRKFAPAVNILKTFLTSVKDDEINFQSKRIKDFNPEQAEVITSRFIQKITTQFVKHLKNEETSTNQTIEIITKMFKIERSK